MMAGPSWLWLVIWVAVLIAAFGFTFFDWFHRLIASPHEANWQLAYQLTVDLYCTLYVLFELLITIYAANLYKAAKYLVLKPGRVSWQEYKKKLNARCCLTMLAALLLHGSFYCIYHFFYIGSVQQGLIDIRYVDVSFHFYYIVCGYLWVLIDAAAALYAYKVYRLVRDNRELMHGELLRVNC